MVNQNQRLELERRILEVEDKVEVSLSNFEWLDSKEIFELERAWSDLVDYYESNGDDVVIGVEVLRSYLDFTRLFRRIAFQLKATEAQREKAEEYLVSFEGQLENIIREVVTCLDSNK